MPRRQPLPNLWMMTDERAGEMLWRGLERLPRGAAVVFRHYRLPPAERRALFERVRRLCRRRGLLLLHGGDQRAAGIRGADGIHGGKRRRGRKQKRHLLSASAHDLKELRQAEQAGADLVFLSPVFPTRSHPGAATLGPIGFARIARAARLPVIALGGMNARRGRRLRPLGAYGWAAIDAWYA